MSEEKAELYARRSRANTAILKPDAFTTSYGCKIEVGTVTTGEPGKFALAGAQALAGMIWPIHVMSDAEAERAGELAIAAIIDGMPDYVQPTPPSIQDVAVHSAIRALKHEPHGNRMGCAQWIEDEEA